jgi:hypothetical protein
MPFQAATATTATTLLPKKIPDLPVSIVLICIYFPCALCMMYRLLQSHKKFRIGGLLIGLCMSRVITYALRSAWSIHPYDKNLAITSTVFQAAGLILLIITNMQLLIRTTKSLRPELQTSRAFRRTTTVIQLFIIPLLIMTIVPAVQNLL